MRSLVVVTLLGFAPLASGCATIVGGGPHQAVSVQSTPAAANFIIRSSSGLQMAQGTTPTTVRLPRKNEYQIEITLAGYQPQTTALTKSTNGWIWGNLLIGWVLGFGIDFLTGSAYKLEPALVQVTLQRADDELHAVIRLYDASGRLLQEKRVPMVPDTVPSH